MDRHFKIILNSDSITLMPRFSSKNFFYERIIEDPL